MTCNLYDGTDRMVYFFIGPYAMNTEMIRKLGNPITTDEKSKWIIAFGDKKETGFCKLTSSPNRNKISNIVILEGEKKTFKEMIKFALSKVEKTLPTMSYANAETLPWFEELGFKIQKEGVQWHTVEKQP